MVYVEEAEKTFGAGQGEAKLDYVLTKVQLDCKNYKISISLPAVIDFIEQLLQSPTKRSSTKSAQPQVVRSAPIQGQINHTPQTN